LDKKLFNEFEAAGFKAKAFKARHLEEIKDEFEKLVDQGLLDRAFYDNNLKSFSYDLEGILADAKTVIIVAAPQYKSIAEFDIGGRHLEAVIPPTYMYPGVNGKITDILDRTFAVSGFRYARAVLPLKLIAVRSGLGTYGRNNICYIPGMGSFVRLNAYITNYEFEEDSWGAASIMDSCRSCSLCVEKCPTGAIRRERFLIHAHECMTNFNEYETPIPGWINPLTAIIQERITFNEKETDMILEGCAFESLPTDTRSKIYNAGLEVYYGVLPRNIRLLVAASEQAE
jgi:epoxyqueuosine reductase